MLEHLGWRFHRIWSTDWFEARAQEIERLREALEAAAAADALTVAGNRRAGADQDAQDAAEASPSPEASPPPEAPTWTTELYVVADPAPRAGEPHEAPAAELDTVVWEIVRAEAPLHRDTLERRVAVAYGKGRAGRRIQDAGWDAAQRLVRTGDVMVEDGAFLTTAERCDVPIVRRRDASEAPTAADLLPPSELRAAVRQVMAADPLAAADEITVHVRGMLGFKRAGQDFKAAVAEAVRDEASGDDAAPA